MPLGSPRVTDLEKSEQWFDKAFVTHLLEKHSGARLIDDGVLKRCSVCGYPFPPDAQPTVDRAFRDHLIKAAHQPGQTTEDVNQAAARIVREATENC